ncbi:MAG: flagellar hook assembly protein FlgD [Synergistaceae bacterium]|jgi:flagellar basal-body rod modification protein FlgD|nr:flagellar hook assembly protein FlgD [Synergistaceae bacterium]
MADIDLFSTASVSSYTKYEDTIATTSGSDSLGKDDFLKLLVAQLTHQDPTEPMKDTEFVSQLATYSSLEQQMTMNQNLEKLIAANAVTTTASAVSLIGKVVGYLGDDGMLYAGLVSFLDIVDGEVNLSLADGSYIPFSRVEQIGDPSFIPGTTDTTSTETETETGDGDGDGEGD